MAVFGTELNETDELRSGEKCAEFTADGINTDRALAHRFMA